MSMSDIRKNDRTLDDRPFLLAFAKAHKYNLSHWIVVEHVA